MRRRILHPTFQPEQPNDQDPPVPSDDQERVSSPPPPQEENHGALRMPHINVFLQPVVPSRGAAQRIRWSDDKFFADLVRATEEDQENESDLSPEKLTWTTAGTTHTAGSGVLPDIVGKELKRRAEPQFFRYGLLKEYHITSLLTDVPGINDSNYKQVRERIISHQKTAQNLTLTYLLDSMKHLHAICPEFETASEAQQSNLLLRLFEQAKITICRNTFGKEYASVDFENIFRGVSGLRPRWRSITKTKFVYLALSTYKTRVISNNSRAMYPLYYSHMCGERIHDLELGDCNDIPTRTNGRR